MKGFAVIPDELSLTLAFSDAIGRILPCVVIVEEGMERLEVSVVAGLATSEPLGAVSTCDAS